MLAVILTWLLPELAALKWRVTVGKPAMYADKVLLDEPLRWIDDYYVVADLWRGAYAIGEPRYWQCNFSYLIVGSQRAVLFDTGPGIRDIRRVVRALTSLPVEALPSHLHFDHVGNLAGFDAIALPDLPALRAQVRDGQFVLGVNQHLGFVEGFARPRFAVKRWIPPGADLDLGGRRLTLLSTPGHTPESIVLLDAEANRLFAGDFIYPADVYAFFPGANLHDYAASADRISRMLNQSSSVYSGHGCDRLPTVDVPILGRSDILDLERALVSADTGGWRAGSGWFPREIPVNRRIRLLAKYPWMRP